jgi:hypothetical protein
VKGDGESEVDPVEQERVHKQIIPETVYYLWASFWQTKEQRGTQGPELHLKWKTRMKPKDDLKIGVETN